jgi:hypothetical protein
MARNLVDGARPGSGVVHHVPRGRATRPVHGSGDLAVGKYGVTLVGLRGSQGEGAG